MLALDLLAGFFAALESTPAPAFRVTPPLLSDRLVAAAGGCAACFGFVSAAASAPCSAHNVLTIRSLNVYWGMQLPGTLACCCTYQLVGIQIDMA